MRNKAPPMRRSIPCSATKVISDHETSRSDIHEPLRKDGPRNQH